jgi:hypothetical protein
MYQKICIICNKQFEAKIPHKATCSKECRKRKQANQSYKCYENKKNNGIKKVCEVCKNEYFSEREESRFCSMKCANIGKSYPNKKERIIEKCLNCEKDIINSIGGSRNKRFCNISCSNTYNKKHDDVIKNCENCGNEFSVIYIDREKRFCSKSCSTGGKFNSMYGMTGSLSPLFGKDPWTKGKTVETDERIAKLGRKISLVLKEKFKNGEMSNFGENNPMFGKHHSNESREQISKVRTERMVNGDYASWFNKGKVYSTKMNREISYRSSWEKITLEHLDKDDNILSFYYEPFSIEYLFEGVKKNYIPDVLIEYVNGIKKLVEIKPSCFIDYDINQTKFEAMQQYCQQNNLIFEVWTEKEIEKLIDN